MSPEVQAFSRGIIEAQNTPVKIGGREEIEIRLAGEPASQAANPGFPCRLYPGAVRITEEGLDAEDIVKPVVLGELVPIIEADGLAHRWLTRRLAAVDLNGLFGNGAPLFDEACGAAPIAAAPAFFVTRQQTVPVILLGQPMID